MTDAKLFSHVDEINNNFLSNRPINFYNEVNEPMPQTKEVL